MQRLWNNAYWLVSHGWLGPHSYTTQDHLARSSTTYRRLDSTQPSLTKTIHQRLVSGPSSGNIFSIKIPVYHVDTNLASREVG